MSQPSTKTKIVTTADRLFYENGFEGTSFADIATSVGISRGNFYHHFKTKDDILNAVISHRIEKTDAMLKDWSIQSAHPRDRILSFIHIVIQNRILIMDFGCPVGTLCTELAKLKHPAQMQAANIFELFKIWLTNEFSRLGLTTQAEKLALHVLAWSQGIAVLMSALRDEDFMYREVDEITIWLDNQISTSPSNEREAICSSPS